MVDDGLSKNQNQRKKIRQQFDSCINNVKLKPSKKPIRPIDNSTYTKKPSDRLKKGSLENISSNPWGDSIAHLDSQSSLRRTRSLAITREDIFTNQPPNKQNNYQPRRAQLIPRAKLIERTRYSSKESDYRTIAKRSSLNNIQGSPTDSRRPEPNYATITNVKPKFIIGASVDQHYDSYEDIQQGLSLPNYYPDSKYDDTDNTDNLSLEDNLSSVGGSSKKYSSCDNLSTSRWTINDSESIPYDDNIVLSPNKAIYDTVPECHYAKPKTIRGPTPFNQQSYYRRSYSSDSSSEERKEEQEVTAHVITIEEGIEEPIAEDELKYEEEIFAKQKSIEETIIIEENEEFKTIVEVKAEEELETEEEKNKHSHNYLREFLESQKGSKKPLQNFLSKKFSNLSRKNSKELPTNLVDNRFYSLPDLAASKNLQKCEKIDRKLRKLGKNNKKEPNESRFIVNIGKHFDITANTNVPVDFELKIAKIPRKPKSKKPKTPKTEDQFLQAVKSLKQTLNPNLDENQNIITKPEIVSLQTKPFLEENLNEVQEITMSMNEEKTECTKEYQAKLGTMRSYWNTLMNIQPKIEEQLDDNKCKIIDIQTKIDDVKKKFEPEPAKEPEKPSQVQLARQRFEQKPTPDKTEKISPFIKETCNYFEKTTPFRDNSNQFESLNPNSVEIIHKNEQKPAKNVVHPEFDHVRYRVVKSDLFQKKIFANCEKESQFDGLMQYLQDYSFQELLRDNNIVIIEPIRSKIPHEARTTTTRNITPLLHASQKDETNDSNLKNKHFFYHPIRVNKEVNDDELPNPDTVKQVRQFFEGELSRSQSSQEFNGITIESKTSKHDPDKDHCSASDSNTSNISDFGSQENLYETITEHFCDQQYVSEEILKKIREHGSTITYYGGKVLKTQLGQSSFTKAIMEEIKNNEKRRGDCSCVHIGIGPEDNKDGYQGVKFRLVKSNSCNSRLELVGTNDLEKSKEKYYNNKKKQMRLKKVKEVVENEKESCKEVDKNIINETIRNGTLKMNNQPRIIGEERKMTQWGDVRKDTNFTGISFNNSKAKNTYDYNYDQIRTKTKKMDEMEFEEYEIA